MTLLQKLIKTKPWLVLGIGLMFVVLLIMGAGYSFMYFRSLLLTEVEPDPIVETVTPPDNTNIVVVEPESLPSNTTLYGYLFSSYSYNCRTGSFADGFTNEFVLRIDYVKGEVSGGCHIVYSPVASNPNLDVIVDWDVEGTVTADGSIDAKIVDGTMNSVLSGTDNEVQWGLSGTFTGTADAATQKASGEYSMTIQKYKGGTGRNPETEHLQWVARLSPTE